MLSAVRSALLCGEVRVLDDGRVDLCDLMAEQLVATTRPGVLNPHLAVVLGTDGRPTRGHIRIRFGAYDERHPFEVPAGRTQSFATVPLFLVAEHGGELSVTIADDLRRDRRFRYSWEVTFARLAPVLSAADQAELATTFGAATRQVARHTAAAAAPT